MTSDMRRKGRTVQEALLVVLGAAVALVSGVVTEWFRQRWATKESAKARSQRLEDERRAYQREHLLGLQAALLDFSEACARYFFQDFLDPEPTDVERIAAMDRAVSAEARVLRHEVQVDNPSVRTAAEAAYQALRKLEDAYDLDEYAASRQSSRDKLRIANERIGEALRAL